MKYSNDKLRDPDLLFIESLFTNSRIIASEVSFSHFINKFMSKNQDKGQLDEKKLSNTNSKILPQNGKHKREKIPM